ncbi:hypothetical protein [Desulfobacter latus]|uniref:Uncharacterized protein n=1 Tax=Desulfobacter latus TaxID=2292 RepID=A0A850SX64_9BACT|nr:hypothetical protein [Desulfobacter latus]NWH05739.1 hypothetical protein [Desulfobacter latus]
MSGKFSPAGICGIFPAITLRMDSKCARIYKTEWHNSAITPANRALFQFSRRDEYIYNTWIKSGNR